MAKRRSGAANLNCSTRGGGESARISSGSKSLSELFNLDRADESELSLFFYFFTCSVFVVASPLSADERERRAAVRRRGLGLGE